MSAAEAGEWAERLAQDWQSVELEPADRAMLHYAVKLTETPEQITRADMEPLRQAGLDDRAIHDLCAVTAYFAFANRIADGLGIELETD
ncbi:MAG: peroxidase [Planctomycetota bacterium]|nr:peroxidase [Planctomycetota bacterium]